MPPETDVDRSSKKGHLSPNEIGVAEKIINTVKDKVSIAFNTQVNASQELYETSSPPAFQPQLETNDSPISDSTAFPTLLDISNGTNISEYSSYNFSQCDTLELSPERISLFILLILFAISTIFGNFLVVIAIFRERYLHTVTNYFIMSLAVADCLVGTLVMPFSALYDSFKCWFFGPDFCDVWHSFDVLASTASILNLCVISLDRYWAITDPLSYPRRMSPNRAYGFIALVWVCSAVISFPAIAYWRARSQPHPEFQCLFTEDLPYLFFSSTISFYCPLLVMVFTYFRIYRAATEQTRSLRLGQKLVSSMGNGDVELTLRIHRGGGASGGSNSSSGNDNVRHPSQKLCKFAKEKKAAKTLGIVMGVFIVCWLPFFVNNLRLGLCGESCSTEAAAFVTYIVTWLGWTNSAMNPVIYACMARDFRR
ncbi:UNVERIFIED_CONTAM: hypothetical protein GTU68_036438 [Idotea baltica]|nr:hypothetical protein [Idotea baltica]